MLFITTTRNRRSYTHLSVVQYAERTQKAHIVCVKNTPTPDAHSVVVSDEVYALALHFHHGVRFQEGV